MVNVSIIIPCHNEEKYLKGCIDSILAQSYKDFELIMIDDGSKDRSGKIIKGYKDKRIKYIRNEKSMNGARARNKGIDMAKGKFLFFTDADCIVNKDWVKSGMECFSKNKCLGVEGRLYYVSKDYTTTLSDQLTIDTSIKGHWMAGNVAYTKEILEEMGMFNPEYVFMQDRELALRIKQHGEILYCKDMIVTHLEKKWSYKGFWNKTRRIIYKIMLYKRFGREGFGVVKFNIVNPMNLVKMIIFPLAFVGPIIKGELKSWDDWKLYPLVYPKLVYERILIWKTAFKERIFLI